MRFFKKTNYPRAENPAKVGAYPTEACSGGGYFYDSVLEYRVWIKEDGELSYHAFENYEDALLFSRRTRNAEKPLALVSQNSYVDEDEAGHMKHIRKPRVAEWQVEWLKGNRGTAEKIPAFIKSKQS